MLTLRVDANRPARARFSPRPAKLLRVAQFGTILLFFVLQLSAQESQAQETAALDAVTKWKIINTAIFAVLVGWFLWKFAPRFFNARSADIQKAIKDATGLKLDSDYRYSEVDRKLATLADEVKKMREQAKAEWDRERERLHKEADNDIAHMQHNVVNEIEAFRLEAVQQLRRHTAQLAVQLAERRLQERFAHPGSGNLTDNFIHLIEKGKN